jgi:long-chain fatty acid transport protein
MNMIGFGAESIAMGGADLAHLDSPSAMNINPAGIGRLLEPELAFSLGVMDPSLEHSDRLGNRSEDVLDRYPMPFLGYVHPYGDLTFGIGLFVQGGMGAEYQGLTTPFSAMAGSDVVPPGFFGSSVVPDGDATMTRLAHAKLTPTVAWRARPGWTLGASLQVSYATADLALFPDTSIRADMDHSGMAGDSPIDLFFGLEAEGLSDVGLSLRLGFQYEVGRLSLGGSYVTETELDLSGGSMTMNFSAMGLGKVVYDSRMNGLAWPQQASLGLAHQVRPGILVAADIDWVNWSSAITTVTLEVDNPSSPAAPAARRIPMHMGWKDQWVGAVGLEIRRWQNWALRLGYNYGATPIPNLMLRPLFPAIAEQHVTGGAGVTRGTWILDLAIEYALDTDKTNNSFDSSVNPFGPGSRESLSQLTVHFSLRRGLGGRQANRD